MATRYSGRATVNIRLTPHDDYIATVSVRGKNVYRLDTSPPPGLRRAVDSPAAYDDVARAALSFGMNDGDIDDNDVEWDGSGPHISRRKVKANGRKAATRRPAKRKTRANKRRPAKRKTRANKRRPARKRATARRGRR